MVMMYADGQNLPQRIPETIDRSRHGTAAVKMIRADSRRGSWLQRARW